MMINIKILLDICDITYTEKQLLKLEKLVNDLLQLHIKEAINDFYDDGKTSDLDGKLENENLGIVVEIDESKIVAAKIEEQFNNSMNNLGCDDEYGTNSNLDRKLENESLGSEVENDVSNKIAEKIEEVNSFDEDRLLFKQEISEEATTDIKLEGLTYEINDLTDNDEYEEEITLSETEQIPLKDKRGNYQKKKK